MSFRSRIKPHLKHPAADWTRTVVCWASALKRFVARPLPHKYNQLMSSNPEFDARIVQTPLQGLLRNIDSELVRRLRQAAASRDSEAERRLSLFLTMMRLTKNCYEAVSFICSDSDDNPKRKREFVLILPPTKSCGKPRNRHVYKFPARRVHDRN